MLVPPRNADAFAKAPPPGTRAVLVFGPDLGLVRERVEMLMRAIVDDLSDPFRVSVILGPDLKSDPARLADEAMAPAFVHVPADQLPRRTGDGFEATVVAGDAWRLRSPVPVRSRTLYLSLRMAAGARPSGTGRGASRRFSAFRVSQARTTTATLMVRTSGMTCRMRSAESRAPRRSTGRKEIQRAIAGVMAVSWATTNSRGRPDRRPATSGSMTAAMPPPPTIAICQ